MKYRVRYYDNCGLCDVSFGEEFTSLKVTRAYAEKRKAELSAMRTVFGNVSYKIIREKL